MISDSNVQKEDEKESRRSEMTEPVPGESNDSTRVNDQKESKDDQHSPKTLDDVPDLGGEGDHSDSAVTTLLVLLLGCLAAVAMVGCTGGLLLLHRRRQVSWDWWRLELEKGLSEGSQSRRRPLLGPSPG